MDKRRIKNFISAVLLVTLFVSICFPSFHTFAFADEEKLEPVEEMEEEEQGSAEEDVLLKTEEDFLAEGIFDTEAAYEYYCTLKEAEQTAFLESLSEENAQLLKERIEQSAEMQPSVQSGSSVPVPEIAEEEQPDKENDLEAADDPDTGEEENEKEDPESVKEEEDKESDEKKTVEEETVVAEIELQIDDIIEFEGAESVAVSRSGSALEVSENRIRALEVTEEPVLLSVDETVYRVTVTKAKLSIILIDGQSNAYGSAGSHDTSAIVPDSGNGYLWKDGELTDLRTAVKAMEKDSPDLCGIDAHHGDGSDGLLSLQPRMPEQRSRTD